MKYATTASIIVILFTIGIVVKAFCSPVGATVDFLGVGTFVVLTFTLVALIFYAHDTRLMAKVAQEQWTRNSVLNATYSMEVAGDSTGRGRTLFRIHNPSTLVVRAKVRCNFLLYDQQVEYHKDFNGQKTWYAFPLQTIQGWFEISTLLEKKGKNCETMIAEATPGNRSQQLTMDLAVEFKDELDNPRKLPTQRHFFDFKEWRWVPLFTQEDDWA